MIDGFLRVCCATPEIKVADCEYNKKNIVELIKKAEKKDASIIIFPELCITGYTCGDLFLQKALLDAAKQSLIDICKSTSKLDIISVIGFPLSYKASLYNCAAVIYHGEILGIVPKQNIPNYSEFYEMRYFTEGKGSMQAVIDGKEVCMSTDMVFSCSNMPEFTFGVEICEDIWVSSSPSLDLSCYGATIIANLSASNEVIGKAEYRRNLVKMQSAKTVSAYLYADAGLGESTTDMVYSGHNIISENGTVLSEAKQFTTGLIFADLDLQKITSERRRSNTFKPKQPTNNIKFDIKIKKLDLNKCFSRHPFVPNNNQDVCTRCDEIICMQSVALATRLNHINCKTVVIGLSGGLDSALALLSTVHAFDRLGISREGIIAVTMPCFGSTSRTQNNAERLAKAYGTKYINIPISNSVNQHFYDIGHNPKDYDITYENAQARERTQVLMDIANQVGGIVIGTGDLSEIALGWSTYNGDHMSMYAINSSIPKTLVRSLVAYEAMNNNSVSDILQDILDTPVSPELLPSSNKDISQKTEDIVGPYELHDFFLYYMVRFGFSPKKIYRIACMTFDGHYSSADIKKWLSVFIKRFFTQQFKRSCMPDGPKVGTVALSPRGDWRMPSDASYNIWIKEVDSL